MWRSVLGVFVSVLVACSGEGAALGDTEFVRHARGGYVFVAANEDETVRLRIRFLDDDRARAGMVPATAPIPGDDWDGALAVGRDLLVNFAEDGDEVDERTLIDERWSIIEGTIAADGPIPTDCGPFAATVSGLVLQSEDGETVALGDPIALVNREWGCFSG